LLPRPESSDNPNAADGRPEPIAVVIAASWGCGAGTAFRCIPIIAVLGERCVAPRARRRRGGECGVVHLAALGGRR